MPTAYDPWHDADIEISATLMTMPFDYTKKGGMVIFEHEQGSERDADSPRVLAGEEMEAGASRVR